MKISRFAIIFERDGLFFIYNTSTQSLFKIDEKDAEFNLQMQQNSD